MAMNLTKTFLISASLLAAFVGCSKSPKTTFAPPPSPAAKAQVDQIAHFLAAVEKLPSFENVTGLGLAYTAQNRFEEALKAFQRAVTISPQSPLAYNNICSTHNNMKQWSQGIEACQQALKIEPGYALAVNNLVFAQKSKATQDARILDLERLAQSGKDADRFRIDLGMEYYTRGDFDRAVETWKPIAEKGEYFAAAQNNLATVFILTKKFEQAKVAITKAIERDPKNQLYQNNRNWLEKATQK